MKYRLPDDCFVSVYDVANSGKGGNNKGKPTNSSDRQPAEGHRGSWPSPRHLPGRKTSTQNGCPMRGHKTPAKAVQVCNTIIKLHRSMISERKIKRK